ncbi:MAG: SdpA family antimicrobial peptide system protein [Bacteroidota bacterium]
MDKNGIRYLKKIVFLTISIVYLVFIFLVADSSLGYNPIRLPKSVNSSVFSLIPQGWGFFTRDPREPLIDLYEISETNLNKLTLPNSSFEYLYGFSRGMRFRASRVGYLTEQISETAWESFENLDKIDFSRLDIKYVQNNPTLSS